MAGHQRRIYRIPWRRRLIYLLLTISLLARIAYLVTNRTPEQSVALSPGRYVVSEILGVHRLVIENESNERFPVRLIGIGPMTRAEEWQDAAVEATQSYCLNCPVGIRLDKRRIDVDGTYLAHVYVDAELLSYFLVKNGLAVVQSTPSDSPSIIRQLRKAESAAKQDRIGFWSKSPTPDLTFRRPSESAKSLAHH